MEGSKKDYGRWGEDVAAWWFKKHGYEVVDSNYQLRIAEIDLVVKNSKEFLFVEVKTRSSDAFGSAQMSLRNRKLRKKKRLAEWYMRTHKYSIGNRVCRFVLLAIDKIDEGRYKISCLGE